MNELFLGKREHWPVMHGVELGVVRCNWDVIHCVVIYTSEIRLVQHNTFFMRDLLSILIELSPRPISELVEWSTLARRGELPTA